MRIRLEENNPINEKGLLILPPNFECNGWVFEQVKRQDLFSIYRKRKGDWAHWNYEVIIIKESPEYKIGDVIITAREGFPGDSQWGQLAWSYQDLESAEKKFNQLLNPETKIAPQTIDNQGIPIVRRKRGRPRKLPLT